MIKVIARWLLHTGLPKPLERWITLRHQSIVLRYHLKQLAQKPNLYLDANSKDAERLMNRLIYGWGNPDWSADASYLQSCARAALQTNYDVLECGSGISTLVMAAVNSSRDISILALEHEPAWANRLNKLILELKLVNCKAVYTPLKSFGEFDWYDINFIEPSKYSLVVCDGPPGFVNGGRYGLLPVMLEQLADGCQILLDDCQRDEEIQILKRWCTENKMHYTEYGDVKKYANAVLEKDS